MDKSHPPKGNPPRSEARRRVLASGGNQEGAFRLETRAGEFISVARLSLERSRSESDQSAARKGQGRRMKMREVTGMRPERRRSRPGHGEAMLTRGGGRKGF